MEKNIGYAVITTEEYINLIINNMSEDVIKLKDKEYTQTKRTLKGQIDKLNKEVEILKKRNNKAIEYIKISKLDECAFEDMTDYSGDFAYIIAILKGE